MPGQAPKCPCESGYPFSKDHTLEVGKIKTSLLSNVNHPAQRGVQKDLFN